MLILDLNGIACSIENVFGQISTSDKEAHLAYVTQALDKNRTMNRCWFLNIP